MSQAIFKSPSGKTYGFLSLENKLQLGAIAKEIAHKLNCELQFETEEMFRQNPDTSNRSSEIQSFIFDGSSFTVPQVRKWLKEHSPRHKPYKTGKIKMYKDKKGKPTTIQVRQSHPDNFSTFRTKDISHDGAIKARFGIRK